jgi:hypothetical protein
VLSNAQPPQPSQPDTKAPTDWKHQGVIYQLTLLKYAVESKRETGLATAKDAKEKYNIEKNYSMMKAELDAAIGQFLFELNVKNKLWKDFSRVDEAWKNNQRDVFFLNSHINTFAQQLNHYYLDCLHFINNPANLAEGDEKSLAAVDPLAVISLAEGIYKDFKDIQKGHVEALSSLLNTVTLSPVGDKK